MKKTITIILILLFFASSSFAATYYVDPAGDDGTGDGSAGNPWQTPGHATQQMGDGDTLKCNAGTYNKGKIYFTNAYGNNAENYVIEPNTGLVLGDVIIGGLDADNYIVQTGGTLTSGSCTFRNIDFTAVTGITSFALVQSAGFDLIFDTCTMDLANCSSAMFNMTGAGTATDFTMTDCVVQANTYSCIWVSDFGDITIDGCTFSDVDNEFLDAHDVNSAIGDISITDTTVTCTADTKCDFVRMIDLTGPDGTVASIKIEDCTVTNFQAGPRLQNDCNSVLIKNNTFTASSCFADTPAIGIKVGSDGYAADTNDMGRVVICGNTVSFTGDVAGKAHCLLVGYGCNGAEIYDNILIGGNNALVVKGDYNYVHHNYIKSSRPVTVCGGDNNVIVYNSLYGLAHPTGESAIFQWDEQCVADDPNFTQFMFNICDASGGADFIFLDDVHSACLNANDVFCMHINANCYNLGDANMANINDTDYATLAAWKTQLESMLATDDCTWFDTEVDSFSAEPLWKDITNNDFRLESTSPCLNRQKIGQTDERYHVGAWQPYAITKIENRSRYQGEDLYY